jgi:hypothetical protein
MLNTPTLDFGERPPQIRGRAVLLLFAVAMLLRFAYVYLDDLTRGISGTFVQRALEEGTGNFSSAVLFPIALVAERYFPIDNGRWRRTWLVHVAGYVVYSILHTSLIAVSRALLFPAFGHGAYDYGRMPVRYFMEASQDFFSYAGFIGILTLVRVQQRLRDGEVRAAQLERDAATAQLEALSLRLQPHFLFNALNTISSTVYDDPAAADELIGRLGELLRQSVRTGGRQEISVGEELEVLRAYLALVEARFGDRLRATVDVDPGASGLAVPAFLVQPLVENAVRHGTSLEYTNTSIDIRIVQRGGTLALSVENDVGAADAAAADAAEPRAGTGLTTTRERLRLLYGDAQSLAITRSAGRFRVAVTLPARRAPVPAAATPDETSRARAHR